MCNLKLHTLEGAGVFLFIEHYGLHYLLVSMFIDKDDANKFLENNPDCGVLTEKGKNIFVAKNKDTGRLLV